MKLNRELPWNWVFGWLVIVLAMLGFEGRANANVYATNIKIDGDITNVVASPGDLITITYILNEPATLGATVQILSGGITVTNLFFPPDNEGALRGFNSVAWDGLDGGGQNVAGGMYSVNVTAASSGFTNWTQTTSDTADVNTSVIDGRGIAVDRNLASPYYGRIFVANSSFGDSLGILKLNADTSDADEGSFSADAGHFWSGGDISPWKLAVSADDFVYVDDLANNGDIFRWDPTITTNSFLHVLRQDNQPAGSVLSGPAIVGTGTNAQIWMVNTNNATVLKWSVNTNFVCNSNDIGSIVVGNTTAPNLFDLDLDGNGNIYTCAYLTVSGNPAARVFRYPAYNPSTNAGMPEATADWAVGGGDDSYAGASGVAVDPTGAYIAVAFEGPAGGFSTNGNTKILWATNGALAANLDLGVAFQGDANHDDTDCAWDAVGNVYYTDVYFGRWRAFSPPGTNQASTMALASIQMIGAPPSTKPQISGITVVAGTVNISFTGSTNDPASAFTVMAAPVVNGSYVGASNSVVTQISPGIFQASLPVNGPAQYYRIRR